MPCRRPPGGGQYHVKKSNLYEANGFGEKTFMNLLVHDSPYFKTLNFNFKAGQELALHSHDIESSISLYSTGLIAFLHCGTVEWNRLPC